MLLVRIIGSMVASFAMAAEVPVIEKYAPIPAVPGKTLLIEGRGFGEKREDGPGMVWFGQCKSMKGAPGGAGWIRLTYRSAISWNDTRIEIMMPHNAQGIVAVMGMSGKLSGTFEMDVVNECAEPQGKPHGAVSSAGF